MDKLMAYIEKVTGPLAKLATFQFVRAIMAAGVATIPFTIVGSAFLILNVLPTAFPVLSGIWESTFTRFTNLYMIGNWFTMGVLALYFNIVMGYELTQIKAQDMGLALSPVNGALLGLMAFLFTMVELTINEGNVIFVEGEGYINGVAYGNFASRLGSSGIFVGILMATLAVWIYKECIKRGWAIRLPDAVPAGVSRSFTALIPCFAVALVVIVLNGLLLFTGYDLFTILSKPFDFVGSLVGPWYGMFVIFLIINALWFVGIHGASIVNAILTPIYLQKLQQNIDIFNGTSTGKYNVVAGQFAQVYVIAGGSGATLGLCIWMCFFAKSEQLSVLGKASIGPAVFNINEPIIFGLPMMYNPAMCIPFLLASPITAAIMCIIGDLGLLPPIIAEVPWPTPAPLGGFIMTANLMGAVWSIVAMFIPLLVYFPFAVAYDKKLFKEEQEAAAAMGA